jgi:hypothetical protein
MRLELVVTLVALLVFAGFRVRQHPWELDAPAEVEAAAPAPTFAGGADVLVVLPASVSATTLETMPLDAAWLNTIEQEVGRVGTVRATDLNRSAMDVADWLIVPREAASEVDPTQVQFVANWIEDGGVALLEQPEGPWQSITGHSFTGARRRDTRRITSFGGAQSRGALRDDLLEMPLRTSVVTYNPPTLSRGRDYEVVLEIDGEPGIVTRHLGRGLAVIVLFDMSRAVGLMQQGLPGDNLEVALPDGLATVDGLVPSGALVVDPSMHTTSVPFADLLERNVLYLLDAHTPMGRLWLWPGERRGALVATHSEAGFGQRVEFMTSWEHSEDVASTVYAVPGSVTPEGLARLSRTGVDIQLQWVPSQLPGPPSRSFGIRQFRPVVRATNFVEQRQWLAEDLVPGPPPSVSRAVGSLWSVDWLAGFAFRDGAGIALDTTFGPASPGVNGGIEEHGYLFGTGYPFRPIDAIGSRFAVQMLPTTINDAARGYSTAVLRELIVEASDRYHTAVVGDWRPDTMALQPSFDAIEGWRGAFALARSQELWLASAGELAEFTSRRLASTVSSTFSREERRLSIEANLIAPTTVAEGAVAAVPSLAFPARFEGRPVERIIVDGAPYDETSLPSSGDRYLHILAPGAGEHRVQIYYTGPGEIAPDAPGVPPVTTP